MECFNRLPKSASIVPIIQQRSPYGSLCLLEQKRNLTLIASSVQPTPPKLKQKDRSRSMQNAWQTNNEGEMEDKKGEQQLFFAKKHEQGVGGSLLDSCLVPEAATFWVERVHPLNANTHEQHPWNSPVLSAWRIDLMSACIDFDTCATLPECEYSSKQTCTADFVRRFKTSSSLVRCVWN